MGKVPYYIFIQKKFISISENLETHRFTIITLTNLINLCLQRNKLNLEQTSGPNTAIHSSTFFSLIFYCLLIITSPIITFFASKNFLFDNLFESVPSHIWSAITSVIVLHLALGLFLYRAYSSGEPTQTSQKED